GGRGRNVVPDLFVLNLNHRFAPDTALEDATTNVIALLAGRAEVEFTDPSSPPACAPWSRSKRGPTSPASRRRAWPPSTSAPARTPRRTRKTSRPRCPSSTKATPSPPAGSSASKVDGRSCCHG